MKNIHVLPTDKASRLHYYNHIDPLGLSKEYLKWKQGRNIYITSDEEIKEGDWTYDILNNLVYKYLGGSNEVWNNAILASSQKIVLTTDQDLIQDGVQSIQDDFLEWFVDNPNCEFVMTLPDVKGLRDIFQPTGKNLYKLIIPKEEPKNPNNQEIMFHKERKEYFYEDIVDGEHKMVWLGKEEPKFVTVNIELATGEDLGKVSYIPLPNLEYVPKQETLEEVAETFLPHLKVEHDTDFIIGFEFGAKWQAERMYSEEDIFKAIEYGAELGLSNDIGNSFEWSKKKKEFLKAIKL